MNREVVHMTQQWDVLIAGGGVIGASIARELSRYDLKTALVEANSDLALGTSGANSGIVAMLEQNGCFGDMPKNKQISLFDL